MYTERGVEGRRERERIEKRSEAKLNELHHFSLGRMEWALILLWSCHLNFAQDIITHS